jgi:hypothetical protein
MFDVYPCSICGEAGHTVGRCNELWQNRVPPPERGSGDDDEEDDSLLIAIIRLTGCLGLLYLITVEYLI